LTTPAVLLSISVNGLNGHGMAELATGTAPTSETSAGHGNGNGNGNANGSGTPMTGSQMVAGVQFAGNSAGTTQSPATGTAPAGTGGSSGESAVLGASAGGGGSGSSGEAGTGATAPASASASRRTSGTLPFTGSDLVFVLLAAAGCLMGGLALRRLAGSHS
jgi:cobalamin biosynthesis Mg chelatase CobN